MVGLEHHDEAATAARLALFEHPNRKGAARTSFQSVQCKFVAIGPKVCARVSERFVWSQYLVGKGVGHSDKLDCGDLILNARASQHFVPRGRNDV